MELHEHKPILVVEDDVTMAQSLVQGLRQADFEVTLCNDGESASLLMQKEHFSLVVLDLMLPGKTGEELLEEWSTIQNTPVIVLTARTELADRLKCFRLGAVDYLPKPFWMEELLARIRTRLRIEEETPSKVLIFGPLTVDLDSRVAARDGESITLTKTEFNVLAYLLEHVDRPVSRRQVAQGALPMGDTKSPRTIDGYIARLRTKLGAPFDVCLETVWGIGYKLRSLSEDEVAEQPS